MQLADPVNLLTDCFARAFARRERVSPSEWIERHFPLIDSDAGGRPRFDFSRCPNLRAIADAFADPSIRRITVGKCAQSGITTLFMGVIAWSMVQDPGTWKVMLPTAGKAQTYNQTRFVPSLLACEELKGVIDPEPRADRVDFDRGRVEWVGSNSVAEAEGTPAPKVWVDEYDRCDPPGVAKLEERGKTYTNAKIVETGSWGMKDDGIDARFQLAQRQYRWVVPCPACRRYHARSWANVKWKGSTSAVPSVVRKAAVMICPHENCHAVIGPERFEWQQSLGLWIAQTQDVSPLTTTPLGRDAPGKILGEAPEGDHVAYHVHGLDNGLVGNPVGAVAARFIERVRIHGYADREWVTDTLGEPYSPLGQRINAHDLAERAKASTFRRGTCPAGTRGVALIVDVQQDGLYWVAMAFSVDGRTLSVVQHGYTAFIQDQDDKAGTYTKSVLLARTLAELRKQTYPTAEPVVRRGVVVHELKPLFTAIDTGNDAEALYRLREGDQALLLLKGYGRNRDNTNDPRAWYVKPVPRPVSPRCPEGRVPLLMVNVNRWKDNLASWIVGARLPADEAADELPIPAINLPSDIGEDFVDQLASEHRIDGQWQLRRQRTPNHYLDLMVYALATLDHVGVRNLPPPPPPPTAPPQAASPPVANAPGVVAKAAATTPKAHPIEPSPARTLNPGVSYGTPQRFLT